MAYQSTLRSDFQKSMRKLEQKGVDMVCMDLRTEPKKRAQLAGILKCCFNVGIYHADLRLSIICVDGIKTADNLIATFEHLNPGKHCSMLYDPNEPDKRVEELLQFLKEELQTREQTRVNFIFGDTAFYQKPLLQRIDNFRMQAQIDVNIITVDHHLDTLTKMAGAMMDLHEQGVRIPVLHVITQGVVAGVEPSSLTSALLRALLTEQLSEDGKPLIDFGSVIAAFSDLAVLLSPGNIAGECLQNLLGIFKEYRLCFDSKQDDELKKVFVDCVSAAYGSLEQDSTLALLMTEQDLVVQQGIGPELVAGIKAEKDIRSQTIDLKDAMPRIAAAYTGLKKQFLEGDFSEEAKEKLATAKVLVNESIERPKFKFGGKKALLMKKPSSAYGRMVNQLVGSAFRKCGCKRKAVASIALYPQGPTMGVRCYLDGEAAGSKSFEGSSLEFLRQHAEEIKAGPLQAYFAEEPTSEMEICGHDGAPILKATPSDGTFASRWTPNLGEDIADDEGMDGAIVDGATVDGATVDGATVDGV